MNISFSIPPKCILHEDPTYLGGQWLPQACTNPAKNCLNPSGERTVDDSALIWRYEGEDELLVNKMTLKELRAEVWCVASAIETLDLEKGSAIAIDMPMDVNSVVIYLAVVLAGYIVVSIADSLASSEISARLQISKAKAIFTQGSNIFLSRFHHMLSYLLSTSKYIKMLGFCYSTTRVIIAFRTPAMGCSLFILGKDGFPIVSSVEIESICNAVDSVVLETAAVVVPPPDGGPEQLVVVVLKDPQAHKPSLDMSNLAATFNSALQRKFHRLFKVSAVVPFPSLPGTATNKVMTCEKGFETAIISK